MGFALRLFVSSWLVLASGAVVAAEPVLVYVYQESCGACRKFDAEVASIYPKTREGQLLPITKVSLDDWRADKHPFQGCSRSAVVGTPTFLLIQDCTETDRITGYSSDELFWLAVTRMHNSLGAP